MHFPSVVMLDLGKENMVTPYSLFCWHWIIFYFDGSLWHSL